MRYTTLQLDRGHSLPLDLRRKARTVNSMDDGMNLSLGSECITGLNVCWANDELSGAFDVLLLTRSLLPDCRQTWSFQETMTATTL
jgi:hypothetical protein